MQKLKKILRITFFVSLFIGLFVLLAFVDAAREKMPMQKMNINIDRSTELYFIDEDDIKTIIYDNGDKVVGQAYGTLNTGKLERIINNHPAVENAEVYKTINGELNIEIVQRIPIARIINLNNESYYIDNKGKLMPASTKFTSNVPVFNGDIFESYGKFYSFDFSKTVAEDSAMKYTRLDEIYQIAKYLSAHKFWDSQIEQVYVNKDFELIPRVGNHIIILGNTNELEEKFNKLYVFYREALPKVGWNSYSTINLKFKNQVVCTKNDLKNNGKS